MSLFLNTSSLHNYYSDCSTLNISETIEHDCLSVLHKLHDQVNGLQLVQVVVQPLAKLFNPTNLATFASNPSAVATQSSTATNQSTTSTPTSHNSSGIHHDQERAGATSTNVSSSSNSLIADTKNNSSSHGPGYSRGSSFISTFNTSNTSGNSNNNSSLLSSTSTYMMSPDSAQALIARLDTDRDVNWLMEIIGYGLSLPFSLTSGPDPVKDCCTIYCEWLASSLVPYNENDEDNKYHQLSKLVPVPIRQDPNRYARKMLSHLYNVFLPRPQVAQETKDQTADSAQNVVPRQAVLYHRVLRTIESIAQSRQNLMDSETWEHLLALLLTVNDKLLSVPTESDDIGTQLHDRILGVLFELMLLASAKSIPSANMWKTFHDMCLNWRHRPALVDHWRRITLALTKRIVSVSSRGSDCSSDNGSGDPTRPTRLGPSQALGNPLTAVESSINSMNLEILSLTWYRFLNLIGNPVELADPDAISRTDEFYHAACASNCVLDPRQHPCLNTLPQIFMNSMLTLRDFIDTFLGTYDQAKDDRASPSDIQTPDRSSLNQSSRGSISSLSGLGINFSTQSTNSQVVGHQYTQQQQQQQATTPTLSRRSAIKSLTIKGAKTSLSSQVTQVNQPHDSSPTFEHSKSGSISSSSRLPQQQQISQPRPSLASLTSRTSQQLDSQSLFKLYPDRPKCNSILHVFGDWLFSAALIGSELNNIVAAESIDGGNLSESARSSLSTATEIGGDASRSTSPSFRRSSNQTISSQTSTSTSTKNTSRQTSQPENLPQASLTSDKMTLESPLSPESFELGQAEAMATLCKIFSSKSSSEDISPAYLSRFYLCLQHCLTFGTGQDRRSQVSGISTIKRQLLASVLVNSTKLLQKDLDGINLLIPSLIKAVEFVFDCSEREIPIQPPPRQYSRSGSLRQPVTPNNVTNYELRRACIMTLVNLLAYPLHFQDLVIRNCLNETSPTTTFGLLRPRLLRLLFVALQTETDPTNMQVLFGGLSLAIHDLASTATKTLSHVQPTRMMQKRGDSKSSSGNPGDESSQNSYEGRQEDTISQSSFVFNSTAGFLAKSLHVTCHLLISIWKHDTQVSLAALEVLTTIARISTSETSIEGNGQPMTKPDGSRASSTNLNNNTVVEMRNEYMQTTKWICDYICNQCSRPPPAHSRDMHSTIVAAYQCLSVWFYSHPYLLTDENCVRTLMEVIELGVSGQKSKYSTNNPTTGILNQGIVLKGDKIMKPSSMRVREAAESLLNICMTCDATCRETYTFGMPYKSDSTVDEADILDLFGGAYTHKMSLRQFEDNELHQLEACKMFKYFSDEDSIILGFLESLNHDPTSKDSVICLLRTPFGKHCWRMRFNYYTEKSKDKIIANKTLGLIKRPFQGSPAVSEARMFPFSATGHNKSLYFNSSARFFPESLDSVPLTRLDRLIETLDEYVHNTKDMNLRNDIEKISLLLSQQIMSEQKVISESSMRVKRIECEEPQQMNELETARMIATHLGLKTSLCPLRNADKTSHNLSKDLKYLDRQSVRTCDTVNIFYVRRNKTSPREILDSVRARHNISLSFFEWLLELGEPVIVKHNSRWTGHVSNSWKNRPLLRQQTNRNVQSDHDVQHANAASMSRNQMLASDHGGAIFDGERMSLCWSDISQELAFLVPHKFERNQSTSGIQIGDTNIIICWLECYDDIASLPNDILLAISETGCFVENPSVTLTPNSAGDEHHDGSMGDDAFNKPRLRDHVRYIISPIKNGLYRINLTTSFGCQWFALPLVDGMTVSRSILSSLIRESVLNLCRRRRLDADSYQPAHVKRRLKIQEICNSYKISSRHEPTEFYYNLFRSKSHAC